MHARNILVILKNRFILTHTHTHCAACMHACYAVCCAVHSALRKILFFSEPSWASFCRNMEAGADLEGRLEIVSDLFVSEIDRRKRHQRISRDEKRLRQRAVAERDLALSKNRELNRLRQLQQRKASTIKKSAKAAPKKGKPCNRTVPYLGGLKKYSNACLRPVILFCTAQRSATCDLPIKC